MADCGTHGNGPGRRTTGIRINGKPATADDVTAIGRVLDADEGGQHSPTPLNTGASAAGEQYLIRKGGAYYRPNAEGYTRDRAEAGRYTLAEADAHSHPNGPDGPRDGIDYELDDGPCTTCWDSGITGCERPCSCEAGDQHRASIPATDAGEVERLVADLRKARSGELTGVACVHGWDTSVCPMRGCGLDQEDLIDKLLAYLSSASHSAADAFSIVLPNGMGRAEVRQDGDTFAAWVVDPNAHGGEYRSAWNLPTFEEAVRNIMDVIWPGCLPFEGVPTLPVESDEEAAAKDPAQFAFDQQSDDPQPGDWNDACRHIANGIRAMSLPATPTEARAVPEEVVRLDKARREAITLIDEINERKPSRVLYGINQPLHAKLCTIRATLARTALAAGDGERHG